MKRKMLMAWMFATGMIFSLRAHGQHTFFVEGLGNGLVYSVNYDYRFSSQVEGFGLRLGIGYFPSGGEDFITAPFQINYLYGNGPHYLEASAGITYFRGDADFVGDYQYDSSVAASFALGYRYQPSGGGINLRMALTPVFSDDFSGFLWGGLSVGYSL